jgi:hypothetical protein
VSEHSHDNESNSGTTSRQLSTTATQINIWKSFQKRAIIIRKNKESPHRPPLSVSKKDRAQIENTFIPFKLN